MPNWVFNNLTVSGDAAELDVFKHEMAEPYQTRHFEFVRNDATDSLDSIQMEQTHESVFSFWNAIAPEDTEWYFKDGAWYEWNIKHWGVKWDASNAYLTEEDGKLIYDFDSPWAIPEQALLAISAKYPNLFFDLHSEEEQGWGAEILFSKGGGKVIKEWDIPQSHADYVDLDRECSVCESGLNTNDIEYWFDDCPRPDLTDALPSGTIAQEVM